MSTEDCISDLFLRVQSMMIDVPRAPTPTLHRRRATMVPLVQRSDPRAVWSAVGRY